MAFTVFNFYIIFLLFNQLISLTKPSMTTSENETDLHSLIAIRDGIQGGLSSWNQSFHFCEWQGIKCGKRHQRVISLNLSSQSLAGSLSPHIGNLTFLRVIDLQYNQLYGDIPQETGRLSRLQELTLWDNTFEGEIPVNLTQCTELRVLNISWNKLSGNIPAELGSLSKLEVLSIGRTNLIGVLPPSLEYGMGADASIQGDVYSYGILVLEMSTGRRPTDEMFKDGLCLHNYASNGLQAQLIKIVDPILLSEGDDTLGETNSIRIGSHRRTKLLECMTAIVRIGVACSVESPSERMDIRDVCRELHTIRDTFLGTTICVERN